MKFARRSHTLDSICEVIGFTATTSLMEWYGGANLCVPNKVTSEHFLSRAIGTAAFTKLVEAFGGDTVWIPASTSGRYANADARLRRVSRLLAAGKTSREIADETGLSQRQVQRMQMSLEVVGLAANLERKGFDPGVGVGVEAHRTT